MTPRQPGYITERQVLGNRLRHVEGRVRGVQRMVEIEMEPTPYIAPHRRETT